ncbi:Zinc finger C6HC-type [Penicillium cf. griseofulvum]|uniref:RBR-type E3 ubiquitin transferase n=1 Tax=Penicillium cf. griseofulvum TaxID=2972120 RepID=A0A9W9MQ76_9EURO|nr:Zinc finger C6HC-type [Penicillium cf. griseofulvum]KAJ5437402.1 Zinc finger C6HC-type [Penicillium cf. griseofulvum]KAJ5441549.1 Zinc finger C6HC-type [Penicillium cf. griseofulvum]
MTEHDFPEDDRSVELSSIFAIFPEIQIDPSSPFKAALDLPVAPSAPTSICFQQPVDTAPAITPPTSLDESKGELDHPPIKDVHVLSHLPPLNLEIELPQGYPSEKPPIVHLRTIPSWLPPSVIDQLSNDCHRLWEECGKDLVVFTYIDHLQQLAETTFNIQDPSGEVCLSRDLKIALLDYNKKAEREKFEQGTFECGVCLEPKKGTVCYRLLRCSHVFCIQCLQDFYNSCITEGDVDSVKCMAPDCEYNKRPAAAPGEGQTPPRKKRDRTLGPSELLQIPLAAETVQRYAFLKRKKKIEADKTTVYCPRQWCQGAARSKRHPKPEDPMSDDLNSSDEEDGPEPRSEVQDGELPPMAERVSICEDCNYAFCCVCKKGWHGELVRCFPRRDGEPTEEEKATEEYLRLYTTPCPTCNVPCQKQMGCNHMRCFQCDTHFCYLCSAWLCADNPYRHFNDPKGQCFNRLWDLEGGDGINPDGAEALHRIPDALLHFDDDPPVVAIHEETDESDDDHPAFEFDNDEDDLHRRHPPPPAPVPPQVNRGGGRPGQRDHAAARAAAAERQAQARAMAEVRDRNARRQARRPVRWAEVPPNRLPPQAGDPRRPVRWAEVPAEPLADEDGPIRWEAIAIRPGRAQAHAGLQRFLDLVQNDREDEWDSDEMDDDF